MLSKIVSDKLDSTLSDIWNYFRTISESRRQTESLLMYEILFNNYGQ